MSEEVTQAAERLRRWKQDVFTCNMEQVGKDRALLADQWLQEHASDDNEPITGDFWRSLNPDEDGDIHVGEYYVGVWPDGIVRAQTLTDVMPFPHITTRCQLRALLRVLQ